MPFSKIKLPLIFINTVLAVLISGCMVCDEKENKPIGIVTTADSGIYISAYGLLSEEDLISFLNENDNIIGYAAALFDINFDGIPEFIDVVAGGSAGNAIYYGYDIYTGKIIAEFEGGTFAGKHDASWCLYYNNQTQEYEMIGHYVCQSGNSEIYRYLSALQETDSGGYSINDLFYIKAFIEREPSKYSIFEYYFNGKQVTFDKYYYQYDLFVKTHDRISNTAMKLVRWVDIASENNININAEMASALMSAGQGFISEKQLNT